MSEKYRFLLLEERREVEPLWNGKTNEVSNIVLPYQTIEQVDEPRVENRGEGSENFRERIDDDPGRQRR